LKIRFKTMLFTALVTAMVVCSGPLTARAEEKQPEYGWQKEMVGGINLTQTSFDNWAQGGENSFAWQLNFNFKFVREEEKTNWANSGKFNYGSTKIGDEGSRKSIDEVRFESVLTYKLWPLINPYVSVMGVTQFAPGYDYGTDPKIQISAFFDPAYFRESAGVNYKPNEIIKTRAGFSIKQTVTTDFPVPYADDPTTPGVEKTKNEIGAESVTDLSWKVAESMLFTSKLELFSAFKTLDATDVDWDNLFTAKISKYFDVNLNFRLLYDKDISSRRQIKQAIALGVTYNFL